MLSWNVRSLGSLEKCLIVRNGIKNSRCDVVCLQETKWNTYDLNYYLTLLPSYFDIKGAYIGAHGTRGGCLITWRKNFSLQNSWATSHTISVVLQHNSDATMVVTNVLWPEHR